VTLTAGAVGRRLAGRWSGGSRRGFSDFATRMTAWRSGKEIRTRPP